MRAVTRSLVVATVAVASLLFVALPAAAHGDAELVDGTVEVGAGRTLVLSGDVHYHRLAARVRADGELTLRVLGPDGDVVLSRGPATAITVNELLRCCDDRPWSPHTVEVINDGDRAVAAAVSMQLVHDDLAVMVYGAEAGTRESIVVLGGIWLLVLWRAVRRPRDVKPRAAETAFALLAGSIGLVAVLGVVRYGGAGPEGLVAGLGDLPILPRNDVVSRASLLLGVVILGFGIAGVRWVRSRPVTPPGRWRALGFLLVLAATVVAVSIGAAYGAVAVPLASGLVAGLPVVVVLAASVRHEVTRPVSS